MVKEIVRLTKEVTGVSEIGRHLILRVEKPIWVDLDDPEHPWTTTPQRDKSFGFVDDGSVLVYQHTISDEEGDAVIEFVAIKPGVADRYSKGFSQEQIQSFVEEGIFTLLNVESVGSISIVRGNIFIEDSDRRSYSRVFSPIDLDIVSTESEYVMSKFAFQVGERIHMKDILDQFFVYISSLEL